MNAHFLWLRIVLAGSVVLAHFAAISGDERHGPQLMSSTVAVQAFFVISGWIVPASAERSATTLGFWVRRFARLYPLYFVVVCAQGLCGLVFGEPAAHPARELLRYIAVNAVFANFLQPSLFGLFADAPVHAFNPSLWTLKIEVMFYLVAPLFVLCYRAQRTRALIALGVGSVALYYLARLRSEEFARQLPGQLRFFVAGFICWRLSTLQVGVHQDARRTRWMLVPLALLGVVLAHKLENLPWWGFLQPVAVAVFVYGLAHSLPEPRRMPDISYGLYILHAPLIQLGFLLGWWSTHAYKSGLALAFAMTAALAALSWYGLEQPAIALARRVSQRIDRRSPAPTQAAYPSEVQP
ncbi:MAG: acyltransferase [Polyangiales bacterium]